MTLLTDATAQESGAALSNSRVVRIPNSGHMLFVDQPGVFLDSVSAFLNAR